MKIFRKNIIGVSILVVIMLIGVGTLSYHRLEDWTWIQSFYFSVVTITTVGYGDLVPSNDYSRLFTAIYILFSVTAAISALGIIGNDYIQKRYDKHKRKS